MSLTCTVFEIFNVWVESHSRSLKNGSIRYIIYTTSYQSAIVNIIAVLYHFRVIWPWRYIKPFSSDTGTLQTDRQTDRFAISITRVSMLTRD